MRPNRSFLFLTVASIVLLAVAFTLASVAANDAFRPQQKQLITSQSPSPQAPTGYKTPLSEQLLAGGFWRVDHTFAPVLIITNFIQNAELAVTPVLYAADGTEYQLPPITLGPAGVSLTDIRAALNSAPAEIKDHFSDYGSAAVKYMWHWPGAASAMVQNRDAKRSLNFNFELRAPMAMQHGASTTVQEGLWWREDSDVNGFLALVNVARRPINVQVQVLSEYGAFERERTIHLEANETSNLDLLEDTKGSYGGIRVTHHGAEKDIVLVGGLENPQEGYSAQIPFLTITPETKPSAVAVSSVGLMLGTPDPMMKFPSGTQFGIYLALRNTSERPISVIPTLYYMDGADVRSSVLKTLTLAASQARHWTPEELSRELGLPKFSGMINLVFSYHGSPSDVIMANGSIDQTKNYVFEINMKAVGKSGAKGLKAWDVSNGNDTMISLLNLADNDQDLSITLFFNGGRYKYRVHLKASGSTMFNVSDIIMMQQPDPDGNTIPPDVTNGSAVLSGSLGYQESINVAVGVGVFNVATATCGTTCPTCFGFSDFQVLPYNSNSSTALVGGTTTFVAWGFGQDSYWHNVTYLSSWSSDNGNVATSQGGGQFIGVGGGTFDAQASAYLLDENADCPEGSNQACPSSFYSGDAGGTIQVPTSLQVLSDTTIINMSYGGTGCSNSGSYGIELAIHYQVLDQNGAAIQSTSMEPQERDPALGMNNWADLGPSNYPGTSKFTDANGQFWDAPLGTCATSTFSMNDTQYISLLVNGTRYPASGVARTNAWTTSSSSVGHGSITNHGDISKSR
jgi:hypothetical protein